MKKSIHPIALKKKYSFSPKDIEQIKEHGLTESQVQNQIQEFNQGIPYVDVHAPAVLNNGIMAIKEEELDNLIRRYETADKKIVKFIPSSGAATRMFKLLHEFNETFDPNKDDIATFLKDPHYKPLLNIFKHLDKLPFYELVMAKMITGRPNFELAKEGEKLYFFIQYLLEDMNYPNLPKGLIPFHRYPNQTKTAFEEQIAEATEFCGDHDVNLHFTITKEHLESFIECYDKIKPADRKIHIGYSFQAKSTDTIAVDLNNEPFRDTNGQLFFRPGGHGALIQNLNQIDADLICIKNIDNVVPQNRLDKIIPYKKALAGVLITIQDEVFELLQKLDKEELTPKLKNRAIEMADTYFHRQRSFDNKEEIREFFNRPIRVCGMVKNEGEPGGGPFWIKHDNGDFSLQIIEEVQIDPDSTKSQKAVKQITHFNPVDLVCGVKNYKGEKFNLLDYVDKRQGFITKKSVDGQDIKALELPGLWNGAMAYWNTIFVDVPLFTFNPVKTIGDLLKPGHQFKGN